MGTGKGYEEGERIYWDGNYCPNKFILNWFFKIVIIIKIHVEGRKTWLKIAVLLHRGAITAAEWKQKEQDCHFIKDKEKNIISKIDALLTHPS